MNHLLDLLLGLLLAVAILLFTNSLTDRVARWLHQRLEQSRKVSRDR
ncbi:MAG TPA: hypothetical protein VIM84_08830 [Gemmatimonadales bacterium]